MSAVTMTVFTQILIMFFIIIVGVVSYKAKLIDKSTNKQLSNIVLQLVNPIVIFVSYQRKFDAALLKGLLITLILSIITHVISILVSSIFLHKKNRQQNIGLERFAVIYSNCGFIGIPLVYGVLGSEGVFYLTAYITVFNLFVWTHGVITMTGKRNLKTIASACLSPSILATLFGFLAFAVRISLPKVVIDSLNYIGNMNTPLAMMVAGATIAQTDIKKLLGKLRIYYISFLKLLFVPISMLLVFGLFDIPRVVLLTVIMAASCPTAVTINLFSIRYGKDYLYSSELFAMSTILSVITIPFVMTIAGLLV